MAPLKDEWGAAGWRFLHACSWAYPVRPTFHEKRDMLNFLMSTGHVLPCSICRTHYNMYTKRHLTQGMESPALQSRAALTRFLVDFHNNVNERLGRATLSYDNARMLYEDEQVNRHVWVVCLIAVLALVLWYGRRCQR